MARKPDFEVSAGTEKILRRLEKAKEGQVVTWGELSAILGEDAQGAGRHHVASARRILQRDQKWVFDAVPGVGLQRLTQAEVARLGPHGLKRVRRMARRQEARLRCLHDTTGLPDEVVRHHYAHLAQLGFLSQLSSAPSRRRFEQKAVNDELPPRIDPRDFLGM